MPLFLAVRTKRRHPVNRTISALQGLSNFPVMVEHDSPKSYFFFELLPDCSELSPVHESLLPLCFKLNAEEARQVPPKKRRGQS
jgi:hypothetical protein